MAQYMCECVCYRKSCESSRWKSFRIRSFTRSLTYTHTHTLNPKKTMCCLYHCPYLYECRLDVCANSSQITKLGNCRARNAFLSVLRQPSLCKHFKPCTVFSAISKIAFDFLFGLIFFKFLPLNFIFKIKLTV